MPTLTHQLHVLPPKAKGSGQDIDHLDFKIGVEPKESPPFTVILVASSRQEKAAWTSDISQVSGDHVPLLGEGLVAGSGGTVLPQTDMFPGPQAQPGLAVPVQPAGAVFRLLFSVAQEPLPLMPGKAVSSFWQIQS